MRRLVLTLVSAALLAVAIWLPRQEDVAATLDAPGESAPLTEPPPAVEFRAARTRASAPFVERWELSYPVAPTSTPSLRLEIGAPEAASTAAEPAETAVAPATPSPATPSGAAPATAANLPGRITAMAGRSAGLLDRIAVVMGGRGDVRDAPPAKALDVRLDLLGERLSADDVRVGQTVIASAFTATPPGDWRAYRLTIGEGGPQCFLGLNETRGLAILLLRDSADGDAIVARFRSLLRPRASS